MSKKDLQERNINLDHHIPSASLLSYNDYHKIPKSEEAQLHRKDNLEYRDFLPDDSGLSVWHRLRKPEFQRATNGWDDDKVINLLKTLRDNQVIPGVILWLNTLTGHIFVLDGVHRLSTIRAWITDDWGDSKSATEYGFVEESEIEAAERIRRRVDDKIGSFDKCVEAGKLFRNLVDGNKTPSEYLDEATESRGRFIYNLNTALRIPIQWVTGDYQTAEQSFININTGDTPLSDPEAHYLKNRRSPVVRAINGIISNGTKPYLWLKYNDECNQMSKELYSILLSPSDATIPDRVAEYPLCLVKKQKNFDRYLFLQYISSISVHGETGEDNLKKVISEYANEKDDKIVADKTRESLKQIKHTISHIHGNQPQSLGLFPAFYFYSNKGQYKDFLFLLFLAWISRGSADEVLNRKIKFTLARDLFEEVWMIGKEYIYQAYGRKGASHSRLSNKHIDSLQELIDRTLDAKSTTLTSFEVLDGFLRDMDPKVHSDFIKQYNRDEGKPFGRFSEATKIQVEVFSLFNNATQRCATCGGRVLFGVHQVDHLKKRSTGGTNSLKNADIKHPFCNRHKDKLEGIQKVSRNNETNISQIINTHLPQPQPDTSTITQLTFDDVTFQV